MKVALVHDWLTGMRGGERCLEAFLDIYPEADIFTLLHIKGATSKKIDCRVKKVSLIGKLPFVKKYYRLLLPLYPHAASSFSFEGYDLIISLSHAAAKNITVPKNVPHFCYCFTPMRYIWDQAPAYWGKALPFLMPLIKYLQNWDRKGAGGVTQFIAISSFIAKRIKNAYGRESVVIYPPVETSWISPIKEFTKGEAYLYAGALVPYKRVDLVIEAINKLGRDLWIVGSGPEESKLRKIAGKNVHFLGRLSDSELAERYRRSRALIFPGVEDFGMIPVECMAAGRPVIAVDFGGAAETSIDGVTGVSWQSKSEDLVDAIRRFEKVETTFLPSKIAEQASRFSVERFNKEWSNLVKGKKTAI